MPATAFSRRVVIVVSTTVAAVANVAANHASWDAGGQGGRTFDVPLSVTGSLPATFYWCSTVLRPAQVLAIRARFLAAGATNAEVALVPVNTVPASTRFAVYDAVTWPDSNAILTSLGLKRISAL